MIRNHTGRRILRCKPRFVLAALVAATIFAPGLQGQERETEKGRFDVTAGVRMEFYGLLSPGASVQLNWDPPSQRSTWLGAQFHAQVVRFEVDPQSLNAGKIRRDYHFAARLKAGFGRGDGPLFYGFAEAGVGVIGTEPEVSRGDTYLLSGAGAGVGITLMPITFAVEATPGEGETTQLGPIGLVRDDPPVPPSLTASNNRIMYRTGNGVKPWLMVVVLAGGAVVPPRLQYHLLRANLR